MFVIFKGALALTKHTENVVLCLILFTVCIYPSIPKFDVNWTDSKCISTNALVARPVQNVQYIYPDVHDNYFICW